MPLKQQRILALYRERDDKDFDFLMAADTSTLEFGWAMRVILGAALLLDLHRDEKLAIVGLDGPHEIVDVWDDPDQVYYIDWSENDPVMIGLIRQGLLVMKVFEDPIDGALIDETCGS